MPGGPSRIEKENPLDYCNFQFFLDFFRFFLFLFFLGGVVVFSVWALHPRKPANRRSPLLSFLLPSLSITPLFSGCVCPFCWCSSPSSSSSPPPSVCPPPPFSFFPPFIFIFLFFFFFFDFQRRNLWTTFTTLSCKKRFSFSFLPR